MSKRAREDETEEGTTILPSGKAARVEQSSPPLEPGDLARIVPEVRQLVWRKLDYKSVTYISWTCRALNGEIPASMLVPMAMRTTDYRKWKASLRAGYFEIIDAAIALGLSTIKLSFWWEATDYVAARWRTVPFDYTLWIDWRDDDTMIVRAHLFGSFRTINSREHSCSTREAIDAIIAHHSCH